MITMNWGTKIVFLYTGFVLLIITLVWKSAHTKFDLVSDDYYEQEVGFQKKLDARGNTALLSQKPVSGVTTDAVMIFFPQEFTGKAVIASVHLYNPSDASADKTYPALNVADGKLVIPRKDIKPAKYTLQLTWNCEGKEYYQDLPLNLSQK